MHVNLGIWDKLSRVIVFLLFLAGLLAVFIWYLPLIKQNQRFRKQLLLLDTRIQEQEKIGRQLRASIDAVQNDPRTLERLAREKLALARSNEVVIVFESASASAR
jgi:cell division protein FtsB